MASFRIVAILLLLGSVACAEELPVLCSADAINDYNAQERAPARPFCITGLVTRTSGKTFVLEDGSGRALIGGQRIQLPSPGDRVIAEGFAATPNTGEPWTCALRLSRIAAGPCPQHTRIPLPELNEERDHLRLISSTGTVVDAFADDADDTIAFLLLKDGEVAIPVAVRRELLARRHELIGAAIRVNGVFSRMINGIRKFSGPFIDLTDGTLDVVRPAPEDPFDAPGLTDQLYLSPHEVLRMGPRIVEGLVVAVWGRRSFLVLERSDRVVAVELAEGEQPPSYGMACTVVGYPTTDLFRLSLTRARFRACPPCPSISDGHIEPVTATTILNPVKFGRLVRLRGTVLSLPAAGDDQTLLLDCGPRNVPVDVSASPRCLDGLTPGCEIEVTGRLLMVTDSWSQDNPFPRILGVNLVVRMPSDIRVLRRPPWWTPGRLLAVIALLVVALLGLFGKNSLQKRLAQNKMADRTRLAVELHDSISQNLTGASLQIDAVSELIDTDRAKALKRLDIASKTLVSCHQELRNCIWDLRNNALDEKDMATAIRKTVEQHIGGAELSVRFNVPRDRLSDNTMHALMRIVRELAANAARHGEATAIRIAGVLEGERLLFSVTDDGIGFDPKNRPSITEGHFGLQGVEERVAELGGEMSVKSEIGKGTRIAIWIRSKC